MLDHRSTTLIEGGCSDEEAEARLDTLEARLDAVHRSRRYEWCELYQRASWLAGVTKTTHRAPGAVRIGFEAGSAVRVRRAGERGIRFAATSGEGAPAIRMAIELAEIGSPSPGAVDAPAGRRVDRDGDGAPPSVPALEDWLGRACEQADAVGARIDKAWIESATTVESWVSSAGLRASRRRERAWGLLATSDGSPPVFAASREWRSLDPASWARQIQDRNQADPPSPSPAKQLLFPPEAAAELVHRVVRALHGGPWTQGSRVGPGWRLVDDPTLPAALFGATFDDTGHPTARRRLADGDTVLAGLSGPGLLRRASILDRPIETGSHIVVEPPLAPLHPNARIVPVVAIYPLASEGLVLGLGAGGGWMRTTVGELARSCVGGWGPSRASYRGVVTPGLAFEGLAVSG